jgi:hypothetical protein
MTCTWLVPVLLTTLALAAHGQDAIKTLPETYRHQFENDWVRVVRVTYAPFAKLPAHTHTSYASAYVYLNDAGPVIFRHVGASYTDVTRPATKAGGFRLYRGLEELHEVENTTGTPSEFLRVEFKTDPKDARTLRGRFYRDAEPLDKVQFENEQVRISRQFIAAGKSADLRTGASEPALLIALTPATLTAAAGASRPTDVSLRVGQEHWLPGNGSERLENTGAATVELLRFDFKTPPLR